MLKFRSLGRLKEIAYVFLKYELHNLLDSCELRLHLPLHKRIIKKKCHEATQPEKLRLAFEELGGAFIKLGQLLALRPDLIGEAYSKEFEKLLDKVPAEDPALIREVVKHIPFTYFDNKPIGCGSIAQVHKAKIGNKIVAVKVKRPLIDLKFNDDIEIMAALASKIKSKDSKSVADPVEIVEEFRKYTQKELDLRHEGYNMRRFWLNFKNSKNVIIPKVYDDYCTENILVMEYIPGKNILEAKKDKKKIIDIVTKSAYKMLFEDRFFHADLHPGNIFFYNNKITFLDFGIVGHLNKDLEKKLFLLFQGMVTPDLDKIAEAIVELNISEDEPDLNILKEGIYNNFAEYYNRPIKQMEFGKVFYSTIEVAKRARIRVPAELVLFGKSIATMQGFCKELSPDFNVVQSARPYVEELVKKQYSAGSIFKSAKEIAIQYHEMMLSVPMLVKDAGRKFGKIEERIIDIDNTFRDLSQIMLRISKMVTMAILFTAFFIASLILIDRLPLYNGISLFSVVFFIFSLIALLEVIREYSYSKK